MGRQIIKQPNGKFCLFSTNVDNVVAYDMTENDIIDDFVDSYRNEVTQKVQSIIEKLELGEKPYNQFTLTYEQMLNEIAEIHGDKEKEKTQKLIELNQI